MAKHGIGIVLLLLVSLGATAGIAEVRKQTVSTMLVTGNLIIETDGTVNELALDQPGEATCRRA